MDLSIFLTENAKNHFKKLTQNNKAISLSLKKSGCSGFSYVIELVEKNNSDYYNFQDIPFIINDNDISALNNLVLDYKKDGLNYKILYDNPNTMNECGCGESFSLKRI